MIFKERLNNNYDFLRLFATFSVTYSHSFDLLNKSNQDLLRIFTNQKIGFSNVGIRIFFAISGFLIAKSFLTSPSIKNYLWKRFLRVQPLLVVLCIVTVFFIGTMSTSLTLKEYFTNFKTWSYFRNIMPLFGIQFLLPGVFSNNIGESSTNGSLWTLIIEERLYVLIIVLFLINNYKKYFYICIVALLNAIYFINIIYPFISIPYSNSFIGLYPMIFFNSSLLYLLKFDFYKNQVWKIVISLAISVLSIAFSPLNFLQVFSMPYLIISLAHLKGITNKVCKYGDFSYCIYIFSYPIQQLFISNGYFIDSPHKLFFGTISIVLPLAIISWHFFESKILAFKYRII